MKKPEETIDRSDNERDQKIIDHFTKLQKRKNEELEAGIV